MAVSRAGLCLTGLLVVAAPGVAGADDPEREQQPVARSVGSVQAFVDPETGRLRQPTAEEARQLAEELRTMLRQDIDDLEVVRHPDGMLSIDLKDRFQSVTFATVDDTGRIALQCLDRPASVDALLEMMSTKGSDATPEAAAVDGAQRLPAAPVYEEK